MDKRIFKIISFLIITALAVSNRRALFLFWMEFLSAGGLWFIFAFIYILLLFKKGKMAVFCLAGYFALCGILWLSNILHAPYETNLEYDEKALVSLTEKLTECAIESYTENFDLYSIIEKAPEIMNAESASVIAFAYPGILDRLNLSGIFSPFSGRAYINCNEHDFLLPFIASHELSHRVGILNEGMANTHAFIKCMESNDKAFRYSASVYALKIALNELENKNEAEKNRLEANIPTEVMNDLNNICVSKKEVSSPFQNYADLISGLIHYQSITSHGVI